MRSIIILLMKNSRRQGRLHTVLLLSLILTAAWFRLWRLPEVPPGFWRDEVYNAMDALWMLETRSPQLFFVGNTGREPMLHYLGAVSMAVLGATPYAFRLVPALVGILTIPLMYRWIVTLFARDPDRYWLALLAAAGLAFSLWHVVMSRSGYRAGLVPFFVIVISYLFWQGWTRRSMLHILGAGLALGISQYTYISARVLPLIFGGFALAWFIFGKKRTASLANSTVQNPNRIRPVGLTEIGTRYQTMSPQKALWLGLGLIAAVSFLIFLPLGLFFWQNPTAFFSRTRDISIVNQAARVSAPVSTVLTAQLFDALRVFYDGGKDPNWRHTLVGYPGFDWLTRVGFWLGLLLAVKHFRRPRYMWLLVCLLGLWLPALLSSVGTLRLSGFLVPYYALMSVGLLAVIRWLAGRLPGHSTARWSRGALVALVMVVSGSLTGYNYFVRWSNEPEVYRQFMGPLVDLARYLADKSRTHDLLIPFELYSDPNSRFFLADEFVEVDTPPTVNPIRPALLVDPLYSAEVAARSTPYAYVWLTRPASSGQGFAYVLPPHQQISLEALAPTGEIVNFQREPGGQLYARLIAIESAAPALALAERKVKHAADYNWEQQIRLIGYEVFPEQVQPGQSPVLNLYWQSLVGQPFSYNIFVQLIDGQGSAVAQWTDVYLSDQHRWRSGHVTPTQHRLWLSPEATPGPYLVRVGLFDPTTRQRVPVYTAHGEALGDQVRLGLFYVSTDKIDPRQPQTVLQAKLGQAPGDQIRLLGYTLSPLPDPPTFMPVRLYWQSEQGVNKDYTVFVQLLDAAGQLVTSWDSQPLAGNYPTSFWRPGEIIVDEIELPLPESLAPGDYRLVTGMYDFATGQRLPTFGANDRPLPDNLIVLRQTRL